MDSLGLQSMYLGMFCSLIKIPLEDLVKLLARFYPESSAWRTNVIKSLLSHRACKATCNYALATATAYVPTKMTGVDRLYPLGLFVIEFLYVHSYNG